MRQRTVKLFLGQNGCGKSFECEKEVAASPRVLVASPFRDYSVEWAETYDELIDRLEALDAFGTHRPFRLGYNFKPEEHDLFFDIGKRAENVLLLGDEAHRFDIRELPTYSELTLEGRHYGVNMAFNSPRPVDLPTDLRAATTHLISFRQMLPSDLKWISEIVGDDAWLLKEIAGPDADDPKVTPPFPFLRWTSAGPRWIIPDKWRGSHGFLTAPKK